MSASATLTVPMYLREARLAAGYANRDKAAEIAPYSIETIGRHERGETPLLPDDAVTYAECYGRKDIMVRYCSGCTVGQKLSRTIEERDFTLATIRLSNRLNRAAQIANTLTQIADNGQVEIREYENFANALSECREIMTATKELELWAYTSGIAIEATKRENAPSSTGNALK